MHQGEPCWDLGLFFLPLLHLPFVCPLRARLTTNLDWPDNGPFSALSFTAFLQTYLDMLAISSNQKSFDKRLDCSASECTLFPFLDLAVC